MSVPNRYYRYGVASEKNLFDQATMHVDGFVLPAQLVVDQQRSLGSWLAGKDFCVDPMTHVWFSSECDLENSERGGFKRSYGKLKSAYGPLFSGIDNPKTKIASEIGLDKLNPHHRDFEESIVRIVDFQLNFVGQIIADAEIEMYEKLLQELDEGLDVASPVSRRVPPTRPRRIILPYVYFRDYGTDEYRLNGTIWDYGGNCVTDGVPLYSLIATDDPLLDWDVIADDMKGKVKGVVLWFSDIDETNATIDQLVALRRACMTLSGKGFDVCIHSGGAFAMGLGFDGVKDVAGGVTYGDRRAPNLVEGGPVPQRYFVPQLLRVLPMGETKFAVKKLGFDCENPCCSSLQHDLGLFMSATFPGNPATSWGPVGRTKLHYLYRFKQKMIEVWKDGKDEGLDKLEAMRATAESLLPDEYWSHLATWIQAYDSDL
jgi:hypothetical protein